MRKTINLNFFRLVVYVVMMILLLALTLPAKLWAVCTPETVIKYKRQSERRLGYACRGPAPDAVTELNNSVVAIVGKMVADRDVEFSREVHDELIMLSRPFDEQIARIDMDIVTNEPLIQKRSVELTASINENKAALTSVKLKMTQLTSNILLRIFSTKEIEATAVEERRLTQEEIELKAQLEALNIEKQSLEDMKIRKVALQRSQELAKKTHSRDRQVKRDADSNELMTKLRTILDVFPPDVKCEDVANKVVDLWKRKEVTIAGLAPGACHSIDFSLEQGQRPPLWSGHVQHKDGAGYLIFESLGEGGDKTAKKVIQISPLERVGNISVLLKPLIPNPQTRRDLRFEADIMTSIREGSAEAREVLVSNDLTCEDNSAVGLAASAIVMPLFNNGDGKKYVQKMLARGSGMTSQQVLVASKRLFKGLEILQNRAPNGSAHCDIKPENMFVHDGQFYLSDYGGLIDFSSTREGLSEIKRCDKGTKGFIPPERLRVEAIFPRGLISADKKAEVQKSDVFALGASIYQLKSGNVSSLLQTMAGEYLDELYGHDGIPGIPFTEDKHQEWLGKMLKVYNDEKKKIEDARQSGSISAGEAALQNAILDMMHPDVSQRPSLEQAIKTFNAIGGV
ncbi:MAG: hypothetical protein HQK53_06770 [Oligoflexia bacterium]|nr:hypothetical protein [Oligoflexia bacterium]